MQNQPMKLRIGLTQKKLFVPGKKCYSALIQPTVTGVFEGKHDLNEKERLLINCPSLDGLYNTMNHPKVHLSSGSNRSCFD